MCSCQIGFVAKLIVGSWKARFLIFFLFLFQSWPHKYNQSKVLFPGHYCCGADVAAELAGYKLEKIGKKPCS